MESLDAILSQSAKALVTYRKEIDSRSEKVSDPGGSEESFINLISLLTKVKVKMARELGAKKISAIDHHTIAVIDEAIDSILRDPSTENKVNMIQLMVFGTDVPFWNVLKDVQHLLRVVKELNEERGVKVTKAQKSKEA